MKPQQQQDTYSKIYLNAQKESERRMGILMNDKESMEGLIAEVNKFDRDDKAINVKRLMASLTKERQKKRRLSLIKKIGAGSSVAAALIFLSFLVWDKGTGLNEVVAVETPTEQISDKVVLVTANNEALDVRNVNIVGAKVTGDNGLSFNKSSVAEKDESTEVEKMDVAKAPVYNTIIVPNTQTFKLELSDGTKVTLNANSKIRFPEKFYGSERVVYLEGEAYFDVTKSDKRFVVKADGDVDIKVYGTTFTVNTDYYDSVNAVLVSGSIGARVGDQKEIMISPSEMFKYDVVSGSVNVEKVDVSQYLGWMNNRFMHKDGRLSEFVKNIEDWYNVEFKFDSEVNLEEEITINIERYENISDLLEVLENSMGVIFVKEAKNEYSVIRKNN